ncbi:MAG: alpha/beta fold hydrolase [Halomonas sp.]|nr:alpha/beta fold hydrolase [Halomonas sp.]
MSDALPIDLHYLDQPSEEHADATPMVVIHGLLGSADNWRSHLKVWQSSRRVIAVDLRNHGRSPHVEGMGYAQMSDDVVALLDKLEVSKVHLVGHSMGGKVAISLAREYPDRVASLVVADIAPVAYQHGHDDVFAALERVREGQPANRREADALLAEHVDSRPTRLFLATNLVRGEQGGLKLRVGLDYIRKDYDAIIGVPSGKTAYNGPTLVLRGDESPYVSDAMLPALRAILPTARVVTLKQAGHWLHADQPAAFQQSVDAFLAAQTS